MSWNDDRIERLKKLWSEGYSASHISKELGSGISRNAVIGKIHRLGLSGRSKSRSNTIIKTQKTVKVTNRIKTIASRGNLAIMQEMETETIVITQHESVVLPMSRRISIMELREGVCRWPIGDPLQPDFAYCGGDCQTTHVYCDSHHRVAYQGSSSRHAARHG